MENKFITLNLAQQNQVSCTRDVSLLNNFENVLTNEVVWILVLFWKKKIRISKGEMEWKNKRVFIFYNFREKEREKRWWGFENFKDKIVFLLGLVQ